MFPLATLHIDDATVQAAIIAASGGLVLAALSGLGAYLTGKRHRQRDLYSKAYRAAMSWREMLYRVRRRAAGDEADRALIERFHELQEETDTRDGGRRESPPTPAKAPETTTTNN